MLKPLHGLSEALGANILSFLEASYPRSEFVFGVSGYEDAAAEIPVALKPRYQFSNITLSVGEEPGCANRKIAKLIRMAERAPKAEIFVLSDANVSVERDHLLRVVGELIADERIGVVTCAYRARPIDKLAARLEALYVNTDFAPMAMLSAAIEPLRHAFGATIAVRRAALDQSAASARSRICSPTISSLAGWPPNTGTALSFPLDSHALVRRVALRRILESSVAMGPHVRTVRPVSLATILIHGPFWALMLLAAMGFNRYAMLALALVIGARIAMAAVIVARVLRLPELLRDLWLVPLKDLSMTAIWFSSLAGNRVWWGGRRFQILAGGAMREVKS